MLPALTSPPGTLNLRFAFLHLAVLTDGPGGPGGSGQIKYYNLPRFMLTMVISPCVSHPLDNPHWRKKTQFLAGGEEVPVDLATGNTSMGINFRIQQMKLPTRYCWPYFLGIFSEI